MNLKSIVLVAVWGNGEVEDGLEGFWFHPLRERRKVCDYLAACCCTWLCLDQPGQGASCCQTENQYSALLRRGVHLPNCVSARMADRGTLVGNSIHCFRLLVSIIISEGHLFC